MMTERNKKHDGGGVFKRLVKIASLMLVLAVVAVAPVVLGGCSSGNVTERDLVGRWTCGNYYHYLNANNTFEGFWHDEGTWALDGDYLILETDDARPNLRLRVTLTGNILNLTNGVDWDITVQRADHDGSDVGGNNPIDPGDE